VGEAARSVGIGTATLLRWQKPPEFQKECRETRRHAHGQAIARLQHASAATSVLLQSMLDSNTPAATRVRAADMVLSHSTRSIEIEDLDARLSEVERLAGEAQNRGGKP